jgi:hypothetical protein
MTEVKNPKAFKLSVAPLPLPKLAIALRPPEDPPLAKLSS